LVLSPKGRYGEAAGAVKVEEAVSEAAQQSVPQMD